MVATSFTCPRCFYTAEFDEAMRFCPHCGLAGAKEAFLDREPLDITVGPRTFRVMDRLAIGSVSTVYRCRFQSQRKEVEGIFKLARDAKTNHLIVNEAKTLRQLASADDREQSFLPFLPAIEESFGFGQTSSAPARQANVLRMHPEIASPDQLYSLLEVGAQFPGGLDPRDAAWIWRRLLSVLGFAHRNHVVHTMVLPMHVLIEPRGHRLVLIDWCCAQSQTNPRAVSTIAGGYRAWYQRASEGISGPATPALDIDFAARCMIELMGGDAASERFSPNVDPALQRYFQRCLGPKSSGAADAFRLLDDFDRLIEALWGPRQFRVMGLPPKVPS